MIRTSLSAFANHRQTIYTNYYQNLSFIMPSTIKIRLLAARNLPVMNQSSNLTDAFVEVRFGQQIIHQTSVVHKSLNPTWYVQSHVHIIWYTKLLFIGMMTVDSRLPMIRSYRMSLLSSGSSIMMYILLVCYFGLIFSSF